MKISKVNHTKSGVSIKEKQSKGILYDNPRKGRENDKDLMKHVKERNFRAQSLYSVFVLRNDNSSGKEKRKTNRTIKQLVDKMHKKVVVDGYQGNSDIGNVILQMDKLNEWVQEHTGKIEGSSDKIFEVLVDSCLRNSLRKGAKLEESKETLYFPDLMKKFLKYLSKPEDKMKLTEVEKMAFIVTLNNDYWKEEEIKKIVHSIEAQDVHVQSVEKDGKYYLQLSNADHKKKGYIFAALKKFADMTDEEQRERFLVHFKQLVLLFYCGREKYEESLEVPMGAWNWGIHREEDSVNFDDDVLELVSEKMSSNKEEDRKKISNLIKQRIHSQIALHYKEAVQAEGITEEDVFWIQYIERSAEKLLKKADNPIHSSRFYLCDHTYKEWLSYLCMKFIDLGKGVYHFTMPKDMSKAIQDDIIIGEVLPEYRYGITSFDYERIKAEEELDRNMSLYIAFAVNNFACSVMNDDARMKEEDILQIGKGKVKDYMYSDADRRIYRFFGGKSKWEKTELRKVTPLDLVEAIKEELQLIRNSSFHYTAEESFQDTQENQIIVSMFEKEYSEIGLCYQKKYLSNNVLYFYSRSDAIKLMEYLYNSSAERPAQVPAFNRIFNKANFSKFVTEFVCGENKRKLESVENSLECMEKFRATLFFLLKEIYYYGFLQEKDIKERFINAVENKKQNYENEKAYKNFKNRIDKIKKESRLTFGELCQQIMTDYNQQNQGNRMVISNNKGHNEEKYKHFRMLLYFYLKKAFVEYLKEKKNIYEFLKKPEWKRTEVERAGAEEFHKNWKPGIYRHLRQEISENSMLLAWYSAAHFMNPKQLNLAIGSIKNYIQYVSDIDRRSCDTGNGSKKKMLEQYKNISEMFEFVMLFNGTVTNCLCDYFKDEDDYAKHLSNYVSFESDGEINNTALKIFSCEGLEDKTGLYHDGTHPIINKNVVYAGMYGNTRLLKQCFQKITEKDIEDYYKTKKNLSKVFQSGQCENMKEEKELRSFQNKKNHIELTEITTYSEIINDFMGQLISWAYLRERDLMYFQLGFYYMKLYYGNSIPEKDKLRCLEGEKIHIKNGAVLYQIIAMYTYALPLFGINKETGKARAVKKASTGARVTKFCEEYCHDEGEIYENGLCLFEDVKHDHDDMVCLRNYIDHFHYYAHLDRSIMELYSDIYDRYFNYDIKLKKSVAYIFRNILLRYFVLATTKMSVESRRRYCNIKEKDEKKVATISINGELQSDVFIISPKNKKSKSRRSGKILARDKVFLEQLQKLLIYKDEDTDKE